MKPLWQTKRYEVACPTCSVKREVGREAYWHIVSPKGKSTGNCKSCSVIARPHGNRLGSKQPQSFIELKRKEMTGNQYAKGLKNEAHIAKLAILNKGNKHAYGIRGADHHSWKGGITKTDRLERLRFRREMQKKIFERDDYTCQVCQLRSGNIQVDHIESWSANPELRFLASNCRTLCMACHYYVTFKKKLPIGQVWGHNLKYLDRKIG